VNIFRTGINKILVVVIIIALITYNVVTVRNCNNKIYNLQKQYTQANKTDYSSIIDMSKEIDKSINLDNSYIDLQNHLDKYKDRINEEIFSRYFDVKDIVVASMYINKFLEKKSYNIIETIVSDNKDSEGQKLVNIYIIYETAIIDTAGNTGVSDSIKGIDKYTYKGDILVNFSKII